MVEEKDSPTKLFTDVTEILKDIYKRTGGRMADDEYNQHIYQMDISDNEMNLIQAYQMSKALDEIEFKMPKYIGAKLSFQFEDIIAPWKSSFKDSNRALEHLKAVCQYWRLTNDKYHLEWLLTLDEKIITKAEESNKGKEKTPMKKFQM